MSLPKEINPLNPYIGNYPERTEFYGFCLNFFPMK